MKTTKIFTLAIALLMGFTLAACSNGGGNNSGGSANTPPPSETPGGTEPSAPPQDPDPSNGGNDPGTGDPGNGNGGDTPISANIGEIMEFGGYEWLVLDVQGGKAFLLSEKVLESRKYHNEGIDITWADSDLRAYLNGEFLSSFSESDRARIAETSIINNDNPEYGTPGGNNTVDKIFLLSIDEALAYFANDSARIAYDSGGKAIWWWLRSPDHAGYAADVDIDGSIYSGYNFVDYNGGVRPALWLNLQ
ncbi:MAG: DUF6273 domain-containing protein [Oscillospiraceae bacterium]|nr:DUF6273 domain-containing protein [Oscillospiraceae bacterium]